MAEASTVSKLAAEFVGTWMLVFTVGCNVMGQTGLWGGVSIACVLMVAIYTFGGISGANLNPAVSVALGITKSLGGEGIGMEWGTVATYCAVQIAAGIFGGLCYLALFQNSFNLQPAVGYGVLSCGAAEFWYTFMLCFVVLNVAVAKTSGQRVPDGTNEGYHYKGNDYYGLAIGFVVVAGAYGAGAISGGCFNPAVAAGIDVSSAYYGLGWFLVYWIFEFAGAALAAVLFKVVRPWEFQKALLDKYHNEGPELMQKLVSELIGTMMLVLTVGLNVLGASPAGAFSIAASLMCMIYALGNVSGAHFNPAVTLAILASKKTPLEMKEAGLYMITQTAGGVCAAFVYAFIHHGQTFPLGPGKGYHWGQVAIAEIVFTFVLCLVVLCAAVLKQTQTTQFFGLAIGSCVTVGGFAIGSISGGSLNPAVSFGIASSQIMNGGLFFKAIIYSAFECIGAVAAAGLVRVTHAAKA